MSNATERYEADAAAFYRATGLMAPGKDVPVALGCQDDGARWDAWHAWHAARRVEGDTR